MVVASAISFTPLGGLASYAASKAGVEMLALAYRQEVSHLGITVGVVHPSWIDTDLVRGAEADLPSLNSPGAWPWMRRFAAEVTPAPVMGPNRSLR